MTPQFVKLTFRKTPTDCFQKFSDILVNLNEVKHCWQYIDETSATILFKDGTQLKLGDSIEEFEKKLKGL